MNIVPIKFEVNDQFDGLYTLTISTDSAPLICADLTTEAVEALIARELKRHYRW